jgi:hypothetical protein
VLSVLVVVWLVVGVSSLERDSLVCSSITKGELSAGASSHACRPRAAPSELRAEAPAGRVQVLRGALRFCSTRKEGGSTGKATEDVLGNVVGRRGKEPEGGKQKATRAGYRNKIALTRGP